MIQLTLSRIRKQVAENEHFIEENINDLCASYQHRLIEMLTKKLIKAAKQQNINRIGIAGGVSANTGLRERLQSLANKHKWQLYIPNLPKIAESQTTTPVSPHSI